jgi:hypothetical protein
MHRCSTAHPPAGCRLQVNYGELEAVEEDEHINAAAPRINAPRLSKLLLQGAFGSIPHRLRPG